MFCAKLLSWVESQFSKNFHKIKSNNRLLKIRPHKNCRTSLYKWEDKGTKLQGQPNV